MGPGLPRLLRGDLSEFTYRMPGGVNQDGTALLPLASGQKYPVSCTPELVSPSPENPLNQLGLAHDVLTEERKEL